MYSKGILELAYRLREVLKSDKPLYERAWEIYVSYIMANGSKYGALTEIAKTLYPEVFSVNKFKAVNRAARLINYKVKKLLSTSYDSTSSTEDNEFFYNSSEAELLVKNSIYPGLAGKLSSKSGNLRALAEILKITFAALKEFGLKGKLLYHAQSIAEAIIKEKGPELVLQYPFKTWFKGNYVKTSKYHAAFIYATCLNAIRKTLKTNHNNPPRLKAVIEALTGIREKELNEALREIASLVIDLLA